MLAWGGGRRNYFRKSQGALSSTPGLATGGLGTHQKEFEHKCCKGFTLTCDLLCLPGSASFGGKKYTPKVFSALKTQVPQQAIKRFGVYQKASFQGKEKTYAPKSLPGVCGGPLRTALVYRFWPPTAVPKPRKFKVARK